MTFPFPEIKKNFGFGCMRLPMKDGEVDHAEFCRMVDAFIDSGFNYFDTAHGYIDGKSETALKACLSSRYPRDSYILANKLSPHHFNSEAEIRPLFESQLAACGVEYFDFYLMHTQNKRFFEKYKACRAYETALELIREGKVRHLAISFHDTADVLDEILTAYPEIEAVQIQLNYLDYDDPEVQGRECYEVCRKHGKPIIVMEPVKGGQLANLPQAARQVFRELGNSSPASYAIRYTASFEGVFMVLSGMGNMDMINDNVGFMQDFRPLEEFEYSAIERVRSILRSKELIPCTACRYCTEQCPRGIPIPELFACTNAKILFGADAAADYENAVSAAGGVAASSCIKCGICEDACPQKLAIRELLEKTAAEFEG